MKNYNSKIRLTTFDSSIDILSLYNSVHNYAPNESNNVSGLLYISPHIPRFDISQLISALSITTKLILYHVETTD